MSSVKLYRSVPIQECGEKLTVIPRGEFTFLEPHPYIAAGAPYGGASPWMLRISVLDALRRVQKALQQARPGWKIALHDAYRPHAVQTFMVERELKLQAAKEGLDTAKLTAEQHGRLMEQALRIWAIPSDDLKTPPPHSTGAVVDCTLTDDTGREVDMGSPIDENSDRSLPDYFAGATDDAGKRAHANRVFLNDLMKQAGFVRIPHEWWHFSIGDQVAAWVQHGLGPEALAVYGRADTVEVVD